MSPLLSFWWSWNLYRDFLTYSKAFLCPAAFKKNAAMKYADSKSLLNPKEAHQPKELVGDSLEYPLI